ncbi:MAG: hypothetical protein WCA78_13055 [Rhizomicrobium sp.]|jgi:hypothetical protein
MKTKKDIKQILRDLRDLTPVRLAVPDVSGEFAGLVPSPATDGPNIVSPDIGNEPIGQATHE